MNQTQDQASHHPRPAEAPAAGFPVAWLLGGAVLVLALFGSALLGGYVYDDVRLVLSNPRLTSWGGILEGFQAPFWSFDEPDPDNALGYWRPLTVVALALGRWLGGGEPWAFHVVSLACHLAATWIVARLGLALTGKRALSAIAALLFALHPAQVEAVAWISAVNDPLAGALSFGAILGWVRWRQRGSRGMPLGSIALLALALLAKESALVVPVVIVLLDLLLFLDSAGPETSAASTSEAPGAAAGASLSAGYGGLGVLLALYVLARVLVFGDLAAGFDRRGADFPLELARQATFRVELFGGFLGLLAWPADLAVFRPFRPVLPDASSALLVSGTLTLLFTALVLRAWTGGARLTLALLLGLAATLMPVVALVESAGYFPLSDRYLYMALPFFALLVTRAAASILPPRGATLALSLLAGCYGLRGVEHMATFSDNETFHREAVASSPTVPAGHWGLGAVLLDRYRVEREKVLLDEALYCFLSSLALGTDYGELGPHKGPDDPLEERLDEMLFLIGETDSEQRKPDRTVFVTTFDRLQGNLGQGYCFLFQAELPGGEADYDAPLIVFKQLTTTFPDEFRSLIGLGTTRMQRGELELAAKAFGDALTINPRHAEGWHNLGQLYLRQQEYAGAVNSFQRALALRPDSTEDLEGLVTAAIDGDQFELARAQLDQARKRAPGLLILDYLEGVLAARQRDLVGALSWFDTVLQKNDLHGLAHYQRGRVQVILGEKTAAIQSFGRACELLPTSFEAYYNLGTLLSMEGDASAGLPYLVRAYELSSAGPLRRALQDELMRQLGDDSARLMGVSLITSKLGDWPAALQWIEVAMLRDERLSQDPDAHHRRGRLLTAMEYPEEGATAMKEALRHAPDHFWANHDLGSLLATSLGRGPEARPHLVRALEGLPQARIEERGLREAIEQRLRALISGVDEQMGPVPAPLEPKGVER